MDVKTLAERIAYLSAQKGVSKTKALIESGAGKDFITNITTKSQKPSAEKIFLLAEYFNVSMDYLLGREVKSSQVNSNNSNSQIITGNNINNSNNTSSDSAPIKDKEVWDTYEGLSVKDKLEIQLDILNRANKQN